MTTATITPTCPSWCERTDHGDDADRALERGGLHRMHERTFTHNGVDLRIRAVGITDERGGFVDGPWIVVGDSDLPPAVARGLAAAIIAASDEVDRG